jgi:natural product precursor
MKTSLLNFAQDSLSRHEMRNVIGGATNVYCGCTDAVGQWSYTGTKDPSTSTTNNDIQTYCRTGIGWCKGWADNMK